MRFPAFILAFCSIVQLTAGANTSDDHHLLLDQSLSLEEAAASPYLFREVGEALAALNECGRKAPSDTITLSIAPGVYWVDNPDDEAVRLPVEGSSTPYGCRVSCPILRLEGLSSDAGDIVLACNRGQTQGAVGNFTMLFFDSESIEARNITFGNYCSVDLDYKPDPALSRRRRCNSNVQAQLVHTNADRVWVDNCRFVSRLNLCPFTGARRTLFTNSHFECTDDALAGSAVYSNCHFEFFSSKPFYATPSYGAVLIDCVIDTHVQGVQYFSKTNGGLILLRTKINQMNGQSLTVLPCYGESSDACYYSNVEVNGKPYSIDGAVDITDKAVLRAVNIPNLLAGNDCWDPLNMRRQQADDCLNFPLWMRIVNDGNKVLEPQGDVRQMRAEFRYWGNYAVEDLDVLPVPSGAMSWTAERVLKLSNLRGLTASVCSDNYLPVQSKATLKAVHPSGLVAKTTLTIEPKLEAAPVFAQHPSLTYDKKERGIVLNYQLSAGKDDATHVVWYRYTKEDLSDTVAVRQGLVRSERVYEVSRADRDRFIAARVTPRYANTHSGEAEVVGYKEMITVRSMPSVIFEEQSLQTDFHNLPVGYQPKVGQGVWTFDTFKPSDTDGYDWTPSSDRSWFYGMGVDGCGDKRGLLQETRGARCIYLPARDKSGNMEATVKINPAKTAGQGFGSATGQYMDICIKFDPETMTGYALRIERVPDYDKAVVFQLMEYRDGKILPISERQPAICYRSTCTVTVSLKGTALTATAVTSAMMPEPSSPELQTEVFLKAAVAKTNASGFCIQHTGTVGTSASMISHVSLKW